MTRRRQFGLNAVFVEITLPARPAASSRRPAELWEKGNRLRGDYPQFRPGVQKSLTCENHAACTIAQSTLPSPEEEIRCR